VGTSQAASAASAAGSTPSVPTFHSAPSQPSSSSFLGSSSSQRASRLDFKLNEFRTIGEILNEWKTAVRLQSERFQSLAKISSRRDFSYNQNLDDLFKLAQDLQGLIGIQRQIDIAVSRITHELEVLESIILKLENEVGRDWEPPRYTRNQADRLNIYDGAIYVSDRLFHANQALTLVVEEKNRSSLEQFEKMPIQVAEMHLEISKNQQELEKLDALATKVQENADLVRRLMQDQLRKINMSQRISY